MLSPQRDFDVPQVGFHSQEGFQVRSNRILACSPSLRHHAGMAAYSNCSCCYLKSVELVKHGLLQMDVEFSYWNDPCLDRRQSHHRVKYEAMEAFGRPNGEQASVSPFPEGAFTASASVDALHSAHKYASSPWWDLEALASAGSSQVAECN